MSITLLKKEHTRLRVKEVTIPESHSKLLGSGIDVNTLPEGHLSCPHCKQSKFECWVYLDAHRLEMGCSNCGFSCRLLFPLDVSLMPFHSAGRFTCKRHPTEGMVLIKNMETICVGCAKCYTEIQIKLKSHTNLVLADS